MVTAPDSEGRAAFSSDDSVSIATAAERLGRVTLEMWDELGRVDIKASALIGLEGAAFAVTTAGLTATDSMLILVVGSIGLVFLGISLLVLTLAVRPTLVSQNSSDMYTFRHFAVASVSELRKTLGCSDEKFFEEVASRLRMLSGLAQTKYRRLRLAVDLLLVGLCFVFVGTVVGVLVQ